MKKLFYLFLFFAFTGVLFTSCKESTTGTVVNQELNLPDVPYDYAGDEFPDHFSSIASFNNTPSSNPITDAGATLGRVLFYDTKLSLNNAVSCGTCHKQSLAFSDGLQFSPGFEGKMTTRNTMSIINPKFSTTLLWTGEAITIEEQVLKPVANHLEMGMEDFDVLASKLQQVDYYPALFEEAFGTTEVTHELISRALAQFLRSMECSQSKYDQGFDSEFANFTALEKMGHDLFESVETGCANCHRSVNFYYGSESNIGLEMDYTDEGAGNGAFRIPSLRNVAITGPFMHDGRFETLEEVVEHYNSGVQPHPFLDWRLKDTNGEPKKLNLTDVEKEALVAFMKTLTDENFITDVKYSNPFK